jgi:hypothetical protein
LGAGIGQIEFRTVLYAIDRTGWFVYKGAMNDRPLSRI